jgi:hypothetical protein
MPQPQRGERTFRQIQGLRIGTSASAGPRATFVHKRHRNTMTRTPNHSFFRRHSLSSFRSSSSAHGSCSTFAPMPKPTSVLSMATPSPIGPAPLSLCSPPNSCTRKARPRVSSPPPPSPSHLEKAARTFPHHLLADHRRRMGRALRQIQSELKMGTSCRQHRLRVDPNPRPCSPQQKAGGDPFEGKPP